MNAHLEAQCNQHSVNHVHQIEHNKPLTVMYFSIAYSAYNQMTIKSSLLEMLVFKV